MASMSHQPDRRIDPSSGDPGPQSVPYPPDDGVVDERFLPPPPDRPDRRGEETRAIDRDVLNAVAATTTGQGERPAEPDIAFDLDADEGVEPPPDLPSRTIRIAGQVYTAYAPQDTTLYHLNDEDTSEYARAERLRESMFGPDVYTELRRRELDPADSMRTQHIANAMEKLINAFQPYIEQTSHEMAGGDHPAAR